MYSISLSDLNLFFIIPRLDSVSKPKTRNHESLPCIEHCDDIHAVLFNASHVLLPPFQKVPKAEE